MPSKLPIMYLKLVESCESKNKLNDKILIFTFFFFSCNVQSLFWNTEPEWSTMGYEY